MSLYVVVHRHEPDHCPAQDREHAPLLLQHLAPTNAARYGVTLQGEAVANGRHTLYLILQAPTEEKVREFMAPFAQAGSVDVYPASPCEEVVARAAC